ncbi:hypothetical protein ACHAP5_010760 [Fusarium lateritium]
MRSHFHFYAVKVQDMRTVVESWDEAEALIKGVSGGRSKGCWTREEAQTTDSFSCTTPWKPGMSSCDVTQLPPVASLPILRSSTRMSSAESVSASSSQSVTNDISYEAKKAKKLAKKLAKQAKKAKKAKKRALAALKDKPLPLTQNDPLPASNNGDPFPSIINDDPLPAIANDDPFSIEEDSLVFTNAGEAVGKLFELFREYKVVSITPVV